MEARNKVSSVLKAGNEALEGKEQKSPAEVAGYIADMVLELRKMAQQNEFEFLAYLLEMSFQEAFDLSQKKDVG